MNKLQQTVCYGAKRNESKPVAHRYHNLAPICSLPPELLSRIFLWASRMEPCFLKKSSTLWKYPSKSPESLLHVCSYWRSVALASPALWTHIDIAPHHDFNEQLFTYGTVFAANAGQAPLDVHISTHGEISCHTFKHDLLQFCTSIAARAKSFHLQVASDDSEEISIVDKLFSNCVPGKLTRLIIKRSARNDDDDDDDRSDNDDYDDDEIQPGFIMANDSEIFPDEVTWLLDVSHRHLEEVLLRATVLHLDMLYPHWTSQAYRGLVKLHLTDPSDTPVTLSQLAGILSTSPQLRFFYFGFSIMEHDVLPAPVHLDNLEVLHLDVSESRERDAILGIISPGSKPLRMSICTRKSESPSLTNSTHSRLFAWSNVAQLSVTSRESHGSLSIPELLALVPNLQALSLDQFDLQPACKGPLDAVDGKGSAGSQLTKLHLASSDISLDVFRWVTKTYPLQEITIEAATSWTEIRSGYMGHIRSPNSCKNNLREIFPAIEFVIGRDPVKDEDWD